MGRPSSDESNKPRHSSESFGRDMESISSSGSSPQHKKGMAGFINQVRTQFANTNDPTKQATKFAKLKKEITDCGNVAKKKKKKKMLCRIHALKFVFRYRV
jgi:hypothetical protein